MRRPASGPGRPSRRRRARARAEAYSRRVRITMKAFVRVFALVPDCHTAGRYMRVWRRHFYDGLQAALPHVVLPVDMNFAWARPPSAGPLGPSRDRDAMSERLWEQIRTAHAEWGLDAVISYCFSSDIDRGLIERTVELGIPWINFFCDSTYALHPAALPEAVCETAEHALGFVGAPTGNRVLRLAGLRLLGCRTEVRGEGWQRVNAAPAGPRPRRADRRARGRLGERILVRALKLLVRGEGRPLADEEMVPFLSRCRVVLGLNEGRDIQGAYRSYLKL